jgi:hypothetical protein
MRFMLKAAGNRFGVAKPWGDSDYDFVLDSGERFWRVQVKSTNVGRSDRYPSTQLAEASAKRSRTPRSRSTYIVAEDAWYVIPVAAFTPPDTSHVLSQGERSWWPLRTVSRGVGLDESRTGQ